ncbi:YkgJ family cysteine cluster protein [Algoriphagus boritolerans]|uniref:YkgJ family cysteine cluster protein n=1 Tax=Algoriphagus boritolerans TaxID=308111 RepID=UPI002FCE2197
MCLIFLPCPFLGADNKCLVYEDRPKACREYPHTNRKNMLGILDLSLKNTLVCPAVSKIFFTRSAKIIRSKTFLLFS